jgi:hypothetical protein
VNTEPLLASKRIADGEQLHFGGGYSVMFRDGKLQIHCWPASRLAVSRKQDKDWRALEIRKVWP